MFDILVRIKYEQISIFIIVSIHGILKNKALKYFIKENS